MIIKHAHIDKFRGLENIDFNLGKKLTVIVGHNGTMKTTLLGILGQTFSLQDEQSPLHGQTTIDGYDFKSQFREKFKVSDKDVPGEHRWHLDLYPGIHKNDSFDAISIKGYRKNNPNDIRFWSAEGKGKNTGYVQVPVYYLSLKRCSPIGEEKKFKEINNLSNEEIQFLVKENKEILTILGSDLLTVNEIASNGAKHTASIHNSQHDALSISSGQDNVGKILLSILSFKRLKDNFPNDYKGGILLIDEIESTFHPLAQGKLMNKLLCYARAYKIQFVVTTHSPAVIKSVFGGKYNNTDISLLYLKKVGNKIMKLETPNIDDVISELSGTVRETPKKAKVQKINIFCEDIVGRKILNNLLSDYKSNIKFSNCSIGAEEYLELIRVKLPTIIDSLIVLDGDKNPEFNSSVKTKINNLKKSGLGLNIVFLPSCFSPEKMIYTFLYNLSEDSTFWDLTAGGYDKTKCFAAYPSLCDSNDSNEFKRWFDTQKQYWGKNYEKVLNFWKINCQEEYTAFLNQFIQVYNIYAIKNNIDILDEIK